MTIKTQFRVTEEKDFTCSYFQNATNSSPPLLTQVLARKAGSGSTSEMGTTQATTSYRTSFTGPPDPLSSGEVRKFADIAGNGFRGELPLSTHPEYDNGHEFYTTKTFRNISHSTWNRYWTYNFRYHGYQGPLLLATDKTLTEPYNYGYFPSERKLKSDEIEFYGTKAINAVIPSQPGFSLATFLGELAEGLPAIMGLNTLKNRGETVRSAGGEYLNYQFGWVPLISDIRKAIVALKNANKTIADFERNGGRKLRRTFNFPPIQADLEGPRVIWPAGNRNIRPPLNNANFVNAFTGGGGIEPGEIRKSQLRQKSIWFKGCFQYAVIEGNTFSDKLAAFEQKANILLGTRVTPEVLWNLAPWSWLSDWSANVGDVLANATYLSSDGLVMRYGYLMCETSDIDSYTMPAGATYQGGAWTGPISCSFGRLSKERYRASPYGFGLSSSDFNPKQWAILAALGLTKAPGVLP